MYELSIKIFESEFEKLENEIKAVAKDEDLWKTLPGIKNSIGNLTLHMCGNLRHFIGHIMGDTSYERNRDGEFSDSGFGKEQLIQLITITRSEISTALDSFSGPDPADPYPVEIAKKSPSYGEALMILATHFSYHLGQVNYLRRILSGN